MIVRGIWQPVYARLKERIGVWNTNYYSSGSSNHSSFDSFEFLNKCFVRACIMRVCSVRILGNNMWNPPKPIWPGKKEIIIFCLSFIFVFKSRVYYVKRFLFSLWKIIWEFITNRRESACTSFHQYRIILHILLSYFRYHYYLTPRVVLTVIESNSSYRYLTIVYLTMISCALKLGVV